MGRKGGLVLSVIILVVVFLAGAIFGGQIVPTLAQSPPRFDNSIINAHECTADDTCEMNGAIIDEVFINDETISTNVGSGSPLILSSNGGELLFLDSSIFNDEAVFHGTTGFNGITIFVELSGNGTAYVCVDSDGNLFRSLSACI